MKFFVFLCALVVLCAGEEAVNVASQEGKRLIQFSEKRKEWLSVAEVDQLVFQPGPHNFMDITDYPDVGQYKQAADPLPFPAAPVNQDYINPLLNLVNTDLIEGSITTLANFFTRYYRSDTGVAASSWVQQRFVQLSLGVPSITVVNFTYPNFPQVSVIATIPGTLEDGQNVVIIGAHLDSVGSSATGRSPGADDDASGTASILEIFRILVENTYKPDYTLQFIGYAGEEGGLLGSQGIAAEYVKNNIPVYAVLQLDMTGYSNTRGPYTAGIVTDYTNADLNNFVRQLVTTYTTLAWGNYQCGYACSDHASWNRTGYRSAFTFETPYGSNPSIHSQNDVLSNLYPLQLREFVNLGIAFAVELAGIAPQK